MRRKPTQRILSSLLSLLLVCSLLMGTGILTAFAQESDTPTQTEEPSEALPSPSGSPEGATDATEGTEALPSDAEAVLLAGTYALVSPGNTAYYVDAANGDDMADGLTPETAWETLDRVSSMEFAPGDSILLKAGCTWDGQVLAPQGSGAEGNPIRIDKYGEGPKPIINGNGTMGKANGKVLSGTVYLYDVEYWEVRNLEVTNCENPEQNMGKDMNTGTGERAGILVMTSIQDRVLKHIVIEDCYVHDVNSNFKGGKTSGGIIVMGHYLDEYGNIITIDDKGNLDPQEWGRAAYEDVLIQGNYVRNVAIEGIRNKCNNKTDNKHGNNFLKNFRNVTIKDNYIEQVVGDGIVLTECIGGLVEGNVVKNSCGYDRGNVNYAQCWTMFSDDILVQYNEVYGNRYGYDDGEAFDSDMQNINNIFQYNLSHDNGGGLCLFMSNQRDTTFRYNVSINDGAGTYPNGSKFRQQTFHYDSTSSNGPNVPQIYNNTIYVNGADNSTVLFGGKSARTCFVNFKNNIVLAENGATVTFAHSDSKTHADSIIENNCFYPASIVSDSGKDQATLESMGNIFADPMLKDPTAGLTYTSFALEPEDMAKIYGLAEERVKTLSEPYQLKDNSPCIRAGQVIDGAPEQDLFGNDIVGLVDIGAHELSNTAEAADSVTPPAAIITTVNQQPVLPGTVAVTLGGKTYDMPVTWEAIPADKLAQPGSVTVNGAIRGVTNPVSITVQVVGEATSFDPVSVGTWVGIYPQLPGTVTAHFAGDITLELPVVWDLIPDSQLAAAGAFTIRGTVSALPGTLQPTASITVAENDPASRPSSIAAAKDTYIQNGTSSGGSTAGPFGASNSFVVKGSSKKGYNRQALIGFDLSASPAVLAAASQIVLQLTSTGMDNNACNRNFRILDAGNNWEEATATNATFDVNGSYPIVLSEQNFLSTQVAAGSVLTFDITDYIKSSGQTAFGLLLKMQSSSNMDNSGVYFASKEHADVEKRPVLLISYDDTASIAPISLSTPAGEAPVLPKTVTVTLVEGGTETRSVAWDAIDPAQYANKGATFTVRGVVEGTARPAVATITVVDALPTIVSVADLGTVIRPTGLSETNLGLPTAVTVTLSDGSTAQVPVSAWTSGGLYRPTVEGTYSLSGLLDEAGLPLRNPDHLQANINVTLKKAADKNVLVFALREAQRAADKGIVAQLVPSVKPGFEAAVRSADAVYKTDFASSSEIQAAYLELQTALWNLSYVKADTTALEAAVSSAAAITLNRYTSATAQALRDAIAAARALLANQELHAGYQSAVDEATASLNAAVAGLVRNSSGGISIVTPPSAGGKPPVVPVEQQFDDVKAGAWYTQSIQFVVNTGLMKGIGEGKFAPETTMSRAMILTVLHRVDGSPANYGGDSSIWYGEALAWAMATGLSDGTNPEGVVTREQLAVMLYRYSKFNPISADLGAFTDSADVSDWAQEGMEWAVANGLIKGKDGKRLDPQGTATRAEVATVLDRFMQFWQKG